MSHWHTRMMAQRDSIVIMSKSTLKQRGLKKTPPNLICYLHFLILKQILQWCFIAPKRKIKLIHKTPRHLATALSLQPHLTPPSTFSLLQAHEPQHSAPYPSHLPQCLLTWDSLPDRLLSPFPNHPLANSSPSSSTSQFTGHLSGSLTPDFQTKLIFSVL